MDNKIKRMDMLHWILIAVGGYLIAIVTTLFLSAIADAIALKELGVTDGAIWEWDMSQFWAKAKSHGAEYNIVLYVYLGLALLGIPVRLLQSGYSLILEDRVIACRTFGKVTRIGYREISDVTFLSIPHSTNGCLSVLAIVFPPLAMYSHLKITGVVRSAKGGYRKVTVRYFYVNDPQFTAVQIRNRMNAVPPAQQ